MTRVDINNVEQFMLATAATIISHVKWMFATVATTIRLTSADLTLRLID